MKRKEGLAYLTQCADAQGRHWSGGTEWAADECPICGGTNDAGRLLTGGSRYGRTSADCAPVAWRLASLFARETFEPMSLDLLDRAMGLVVNEHPDVAYFVRNYGGGKYR